MAVLPRRVICFFQIQAASLPPHSLPLPLLGTLFFSDAISPVMPCDPQRSFSSAFGWDGGLLRFSPAPSDQRGSFPRHSPAFPTAPSFAAEGMTCLSCKFLHGHAAFCRYRAADVHGKPEREAGDSRIPFQKVRKPLNRHLRALLPAGDCHQERIPAVPGQEESPVRIRQLPERCSRQEQCLCLPDAGPDRGVGASLPHTMWAGSASRRSISSCLGSQSPRSVKSDMAHCSLEVRLPCGIVKAQHAGKALEAVG